MTEHKIRIGEKEYPCRQTMGAMLRFKRLTGMEVTEIQTSVTAMVTFMFCCAESSCKHDGVDFGMELEDFADSLEAADVTAWTAQFLEDDASGAEAGEKKTSA